MLQLALPLALALTGPASVPAPPTGNGGAHDWPQWNGPAGDGVSTETAWSSAGKADDLWESEVGLGYSTVVVGDGRLYTMGYDVEAGLDVIWCLDALTGEELWAFTYPAKIWNEAHEGGTVNTPSLDGDRLYTLNREGNAYCFDAGTGAVKWHHDLAQEHQLTPPRWGFAASPLVLGDELVLNCNKLIGVDKKTGELRWSTKTYGDGYGTPRAFTYDGKPVVAALNATGLAVVGTAKGEEIAFHDFGSKSLGIQAATPVCIDDTLFVSSGPRGSGALFALEDDQLVEVWEKRSMSNRLSGCVRVGDCLYGFNQEVLSCIDLDGNVKWEERGIGLGAVTGTPDRLLVMGGTGELIVIAANPERYEELSRAPLFDEGSYWSKPILANGIVYCRSSKGRLVARDHRVAAGGAPATKSSD